MSEKLLACEVFPGMFSDELAVRYSAKTSAASVFVPKASVVSIDGSFVRVNVFKDGATTWAVLPNETRTIIEVDADDLK